MKCVKLVYPKTEESSNLCHCASQQISYPQDINLLNEARENLEAIIDTICYEYNDSRPRMYRIKARNAYLSLAKCKRRSPKKIRQAIKKQLKYVRRDLGYVDILLEQEDTEFNDKQQKRINVI